MHPLKELRKLLEKTSPNRGTVIKNGTILSVITNKGQMSIAPTLNDATKYKNGDEVILVNGVIVGRRKKTPPVYVL